MNMNVFIFMISWEIEFDMKKTGSAKKSLTRKNVSKEIIPTYLKESESSCHQDQ